MAVLSRSGMEIGLTLFFLTWFWRRMAVRALEEQGISQAFASGLLASCAILSRLDICIAITMYGLFFLRARWRQDVIRTGLPFMVGLAPVFAYVVTNITLFDT